MHEVAILPFRMRIELYNLIGTSILARIPSMMLCFCGHTLMTIDRTGLCFLFPALRPFGIDELLNLTA